MTIVNNNATVHSGLLVTGAGDALDIDVELIGGRTLRMSAAGGELGTWPIEDCRIEADPTGDGSFRIVVDGDDAIFTAVDPEGFSSLVAIIKERGVGSDSDDDSSPPPSAVPTTDAESADDPVAFPFTPAPPPTSHTDLAAFENLDDVISDDRLSEGHLLSEEDVVPTVDLDPAPSSDRAPSTGDLEEDQSDATEPEAAETAGPRFGGSALDRVSSAIGSMASTA
ncbi:MAG: hypothetical protein WEA76_07630, partial [Acidimicrobiia bacterium]